MNSLRIAVVTTGRFHVCDLARELMALGHEVRFYSLVPPSRTERFGIPRGASRWMLPRVPFAALRARLARSSKSKSESIDRLTLAFSRAVGDAIEPCDLVIGMSGVCNNLGPIVKKKFGAKLWVERGSRHIRSQNEILCRGPSGYAITPQTIERELKDYEQADTVVVLSKHCEESFIDQGFDAARVFRNPLGVDLRMFAPSMAPTCCPPKIIMTGIWCWRKGCDVLLEAWRSMKEKAELWHVGPVTDLPLPSDNGFTHFDRVEQSKLKEFYSASAVFALASREEGLATVQPQALACGLRLVCTNRTGGEDLRDMIASKELISVVPVENVAALSASLDEAIRASSNDSGMRNRLSKSELEALSWKGSAERYSCEILRRLSVS